MVKKILAVVLILALTVGAGVGGAYWKQTHHGDAEASQGEGKSFSPKNVFYQKMEKSLTVPILKRERQNDQEVVKVTAIVVAEITLEVTKEETKDLIRIKEPRLRDAFLQVFYRQVAEGSFEETMLTEKVQAQLRRDLLKVARDVLGVDQEINAVLINDIQRQDV